MYRCVGQCRWDGEWGNGGGRGMCRVMQVGGGMCGAMQVGGGAAYISTIALSLL